MSRQTPYFPLGGGLDVASPVLQMPPGKMIAGQNFEPFLDHGYRRMRGHERFDGRPKPSDAIWTWLKVDDASGVSVGDTITGDTSGATGKVVYIDTETDVDVPSLVVTKVTGEFEEETADTAAFTITSATINGAPNIDMNKEYRFASQEEYRVDIGIVPGEGEVRGVWQIRDRVYAFRDNAARTIGKVYKATPTGWSDADIVYPETLKYVDGTTDIEPGDVITGGTSAATGTVHKVVVNLGDTSTNDASGYLVLINVTGTFSDGEALNVAASQVATANEGNVLYQIPPGGRYDFVSENFLASAGTYRLYCANGVGPALEIDENDIVTPILLDLTLGDSPTENKPFLVESFDGALWLMFEGGSLQKSVTGDPLTFNGFLGAAEFGLGEEGTALINSAGKVLVAYTRRQTHGIFPVETSYQKRLISERSGCILYGAQELDTVMALDDAGLTDVARAEVFGDFAGATVSAPIQPILFANRERVAGTYVVKETNQFRVLYTNATGVIGRKRLDGVWEFATFSMGIPSSIVFAATCEDENTEPTYWACGSDGFVYNLERGINHDGLPLESFLRLPFNAIGNPSENKRFRLALVDMQASEDKVELVCAVDRNFGDQNFGTAHWNDGIDTVWAGGGFYDLDDWDESYWDSAAYDSARFELRGSGTNVSLLLYHVSDKTSPFVLQGVIIHYDPRRVSR